jgi:hypothetical protein
LQGAHSKKVLLIYFSKCWQYTAISKAQDQLKGCNYWSILSALSALRANRTNAKDAAAAASATAAAAAAGPPNAQ